MLHFTISLKTSFGNADFIFDPIFTGEGVRYHLSVRDESGRSIFFDMTLKDKEWHIINAPKVPDWVMQLQTELSTAIIKHHHFDHD